MSFTFEIASLYSYVFNLLGIIILISALIVVSALNAIHRVALLIVVFLCGAFIFLILDYFFLGLTYIIVYVGAIAILFLFVIMMVQIHIAPSNQERFTHSTNLSGSLTMNKILGPLILIVGIIAILVLLSFNNLSLSSLLTDLTSTLGVHAHTFGVSGISTFFLPTWAIEFKTMTDIETLAIGIAVAYPTALYLIGIALWAVLIGIIAITRRS